MTRSVADAALMLQVIASPDRRDWQSLPFPPPDYRKGLSDGGQPIMPLTKTFFSEKFGMIADRFGVTWMVLVNSKKPM